jgi:hypothetical protein
MNSKGLLDDALVHITAGDFPGGMTRIQAGLTELRRALDMKSWHHLLETEILVHPLCKVFHDDPFTRRSFEKPRGYAGDAVLLDMIYRHPHADLDGAPELGRRIGQFCIDQPACQAVRSRRALLARTLDDMAARRNMPKVLSVACGHLREIELSDAAQSRALGAYVALDQDPASLEEVRQAYASLGVTAMEASVRDLIKGTVFDRSSFDLVYAAGLYDYLEDRVAALLTRRLFALLSAGGELLVSNFLPGIIDQGYMESFMGWFLIYRHPYELAAVARDLPLDQVAGIELFTERKLNIGFLRIVKKA